ncbi:ABC transporter substrate-binding protein [Variovorax sp. J31P207]|uniref:ABC transporter substrate-binding protein n=1 Tax=Variovorax sp. J31P207 TaxID=3053510 RepID=UPI0025751C5D|nr:ABC transporter substrate-binding protein [Variovorax sp. J31P207]MDM0071588.1 ABC transporter substrate-binding protein [Variovorax sp. J31P207]
MKQIFAALVGAGLAVSAIATSAQTVVNKGEFTVAVVANYAPMEFKDPGTGKLTGFDVELAEAIAAKLGLKIRFEETSFDQMMSAVATGRVDVVISGMNDLPSRRDRLRFVDYLKAGPQFFTLSSRSNDIKKMSDLCGKKVGASRRTAFPSDIAAWSEAECVKKGLPAVIVLGTDGSADARTQLRQGRLDAAVQGAETLPYLQKIEPNAFVAIGTPITYVYMGIAVGRSNEGLAKAIATGLDKMLKDGTYAAIASKWGLSSYAVSSVLIDSAE